MRNTIESNNHTMYDRFPEQQLETVSIGSTAETEMTVDDNAVQTAINDVIAYVDQTDDRKYHARIPGGANTNLLLNTIQRLENQHWKGAVTSEGEVISPQKVIESIKALKIAADKIPSDQVIGNKIDLVDSLNSLAADQKITSEFGLREIAVKAILIDITFAATMRRFGPQQN